MTLFGAAEKEEVVGPKKPEKELKKPGRGKNERRKMKPED